MTRSSADPTAPPTPRRPVGPVAGSPQSRWVRARRVCPMASKARVIHSPHSVEAHTARTDSFAVRPQLRTRSLTRRGPTRYRSPKTLNRSHQSRQTVLPETRMRFPCRMCAPDLEPQRHPRTRPDHISPSRLQARAAPIRRRRRPLALLVVLDRQAHRSRGVDGCFRGLVGRVGVLFLGL